MRKTLVVMLVSTLVLGGCGTLRDSRLNPLNWFGRAQSTANVGDGTNPLIPTSSGLGLRREPAAYAGRPVDRITGLVIEPLPGGAILRIEAVAARQGAYEVRVSDAAVDDPAILSLTLLARMPDRPTAVGSEATRRITAARFVSDQELAQVREIRVAGARNTMTSRR